MKIIGGVPMRIVHIEAYYPSKLGYHLSYIAPYQKRKGNDVFVITSDRLWPSQKDYESTLRPILGPRCVASGVYTENDVSTYRLGSFEYKVICYLRGLRRLLERIRPDMVHVHHVFWNPAAIQTALWKPKLGYGLLYDSHVADYNTNLRGTMIKNMVSMGFQLYVSPLLKHRADFITAIGESERDVLCRELRLKPEDIPIIPLGTDIQAFRFDAQRRCAVRQMLSIGNEELMILTSGKITRDKDIPILLEAFARVVALGIPSRLVIVGNGPEDYLGNLKKIIMHNEYLQGKVTFIGAVPHSDLVSYYSAADVGVWAGGPTISIREAIACSLPVIIADNTTCGYAYSGEELVSRGNGVRFPRGDAYVLSEQLVMLFRNDRAREHMRMIARRFAEEELSWDVIADSYLELYKEALRRNHRES
ncbi:MAG: glycosyltransferase family 4 protein [Firmicutes bacterium]|nr:glycosyltransferase family 4 protein [Bacillota bacterium]